jgi:hypothetical protein
MLSASNKLSCVRSRLSHGQKKFPFQLFRFSSFCFMGLGQLLAEAFSRGCECRHWSLSVSSSPSPSLKSSLKLNQTFALTLIWAREQLPLRATVRFPCFIPLLIDLCINDKLNYTCAYALHLRCMLF